MKIHVGARFFLLFVLLFSWAAGAGAGNMAMLVTQSVPNSMEESKEYMVSVTFKNTGTTTWTAADKYYLADLNRQTYFLWGFTRVDLADDEAVKPGDLKTFKFKVRAPAHTRGKYRVENFQWGLVQDGVEWLSLGANVEVGVFYAPSLVSRHPPVAAPVAVAADFFSFANFRGANVLQQTYEDERKCDHTAWIPDADQARIIADRAVEMGLSFLRMPIILPPKAPGTPREWGLTVNNCADIDKLEWYSADNALNMQQVIARTRAVLDQASAANLKVILVLDGYTKYDRSCYWKQSFLDVKDNADAFVKQFKSHPALLAWDVMNEPLWNASYFDCLADQADYESVNDAIHAMYNLVRSNDSIHPTTVGEAQVPLTKYWKDISSFASPHLYPTVNEKRLDQPPVNNLEQINYVQSATIRELVKASGPMPMVIGEFGLAGSEGGSGSLKSGYYERYLNGLAMENKGFILWSMSLSSLLSQQEISVLTPDGTLKAAAQVVERRQWYPVVQQLYLGYTGRPADPAALEQFSSALVSLAIDMKSRSIELKKNLVSLDLAYRSEPQLRALIDNLYNGLEFQSLYPPGDVPKFVSLAYLTVYNRPPDAEGMKYWVDQITLFGLEKQRALLSIIAGSAMNNTPLGLLSAATLAKKSMVAGNFSASLNTPARIDCYGGDAAAASGRLLLKGVSSATDVKAFQSMVEVSLVGMCGR